MRRPKNAGVSLMELMIAIVIVAILTVMTYVLLFASIQSFSAGVTAAALNGQARDLLERLFAEIVDAGISSLQPPFPNGSSSLTFQRNLGYSAGALTFDTPATLSFAYAPGEANDGIDNNNDGRIDEGRLMRIKDGDTVVLSNDLAEGGIAFTQNGNAIRIVVTLEKVESPGRVLRTVSEVTVQVRN